MSVVSVLSILLVVIIIVESGVVRVTPNEPNFHSLKHRQQTPKLSPPQLQKQSEQKLAAPPKYPWITRRYDCGYSHCVEIDFSRVPSSWEILGSNPSFSSLFLLTPSDGPEPGTNPPSCVNDAPGQNGAYKCLFANDLLRVYNSTLEMTVLGPTEINGTVLVSQVTFFDPYTTNNNVTLASNGYFEVYAQTPPVPGTCVGIFTQAFPPPPVHFDEQDIEILTAHYNSSDENVTGGINFVNWNAFPTNSSDRELHFTLPFEFDPTSDYFVYSIFWNNIYTQYKWGSQTNVVRKYSSQNPSVLSVNHWSDGGWYWSQGPPLTNSVLKVKKITAYYNV